MQTPKKELKKLLEPHVISTATLYTSRHIDFAFNCLDGDIAHDFTLCDNCSFIEIREVLMGCFLEIDFI